MVVLPRLLFAVLVLISMVGCASYRKTLNVHGQPDTWKYVQYGVMPFIPEGQSDAMYAPQIVDYGPFFVRDHEMEFVGRKNRFLIQYLMLDSIHRKESWVEVRYIDDAIEEQRIYFRVGRTLGIAGLVGGNSRLQDALEQSMKAAHQHGDENDMEAGS